MAEHLYIENPKESSKKTTRISEFSDVAGRNINIQNLIVFLFTCNRQSRNEIIPKMFSRVNYTSMVIFLKGKFVLNTFSNK